MQPYKNKSKCGFSCGKKAKWKAQGGNGPYDVRYACHDHKERIAHLPDVEDGDNGKLTEADYQSWMRI